jgi:hypothetical protein
MGIGQESQRLQDPTDYTRFVVLSHPRTGSTLLVQALNSNPGIVCLGEVFNWVHHYVGYDLKGYDNYREEDYKLRNKDPVAFLHSRVFSQQPETIRALGFKLHYYHCSPPWGFTGLAEHLAQDNGTRVIHLQRRNLLKTLVSNTIGQRTGDWARSVALPPLRSVPKAVIHPARALQRATSIISVRISRAVRNRRVTLSPEECRAYFEETESLVSQFDELFRDHAKLTVLYEDILSDRDEVFARAQSFLGLEPQPVTTTLQKKQNPDDLRVLLENYEELHQAFADTKYADFFQ